MTRRPQTPSQTVGPFFHLRLGGERQNVLVRPGVDGEIRIEGRVVDGDAQPVGDALIELWQADEDGRYCHPDDRWPPAPGQFTGFGRATTDAQSGVFVFETVKPGRAPGRAQTRLAPHASLIVFARGLLGHLHTRIYFSDETRANDEDPVLARVPPERRRTLMATRTPTVRRARCVPTYRYDVVLQGDNETVFFDV